MLHSTVSHINAHITSIFSKQIDFNTSKLNPKDHVIKDKIVRIQYEKFVSTESRESFKIPKELTIKVKGSGYTAFVRSFLLGFSDIDVETWFAKTFKKLKDVHTVEKFLEFGFPIRNTFVDQTTNTTVYEFDLTKRWRIMEILAVKSLPCYPLIFVLFNNVNFASGDVVYNI